MANGTLGERLDVREACSSEGGEVLSQPLFVDGLGMDIKIEGEFAQGEK